MKFFLFFLIFTITSIYPFCQTIENDPTFNIGQGSGDGFNHDVLALIIQSDGKIVVGGRFTFFKVTSRNRIARLNSDGTIDETFDPGIGFNGSVCSVAEQSDGKIVVGGFFSEYNGTPRNRIARLNTDGTLDSTFDPGTGFNSVVFSLILQDDEKIVVGGMFTDFDGTPRNRIARLNTDGTIDTTFDPGTGFNDIAGTFAMQSDGKIIVGGIFTEFNGTVINSIARLNTDGALDVNFDPGTGCSGGVVSIAVQNDDKIIIGGDFTSFNGTGINRITRLNTDGTQDVIFNPGTGFNHTVSAIVIQSDGNIIVGGNFTSFNGTGINRILRLNTDGTVDTNFDPGTGFNDYISTLVIQDNDRILAGGHFTSYNSIGRNRVARLLGECMSLATDVQTVCDSFNWIDGNTYTTNNNTAIHTLTNAAGCDSLVILDLTLNSSTSGTDIITSCDSYTWIDGNEYLSNNNTATFMLTNAVGCDSMVILDLTLNSSTSGTDIITSCDSYIWIDGNEYLSNNNTATFMLTNAVGCDSIVSLDLTINTVDASVTSNDITITATNFFATYQWIDCDNNNTPITNETSQSFTATENSGYAVIITSTLNTCVDTSDCVTISIIGVNELFPDNYLGLYPNPNSGKFTLQNNSNQSMDFTIYNAMGQSVFKDNISSSSETNLNLIIPSGIYLVTIQQNDTRVTKKMVVR